MFLKPADKRLHNAVLLYWIIKVDGIPVGTKMLPDGFSDIMLNFGSSYQVRYGEEPAIEVKDSCFYGQRTRYMQLHQPGVVNMIGIRIMPGMEYVFTGRDVQELCNTVTSLKDLHIPTNDIKERLRNVATGKEITSVIDAWLVNILEEKNIKFSEEVVSTASYLQQHPQVISVESIAAEKQLSYKQLERRFNRHLGLSPKMYHRVCRFYKAFTMIRSRKNAEWMQVLSDCGYYDQSHFIRDFKFFSGRSPSKQFMQKDTIDEFFGFG